MKQFYINFELKNFKFLNLAKTSNIKYRKNYIEIFYFGDKMKLDLSSFNKAITSFKIAIDEYNKDTKNFFVRDSVIQRFEYTYSLALKMIKRYLENNEENVNEFSFNELIRTANEKGLLLGNLENWNDYRLKRNITNHTYDADKAQEIISIVDNFYNEVKFLYKELEKRND